MKPEFFIGVDISKLTLDVALLQDGMLVKSLKIDNSEKAVKALLVTFKKEYRCGPDNVLFCAEQMGLFHTFLAGVLVKKKIILCLESPLRIKRSLGLQRGKNDQIDAVRIAQYAYKNYESLLIWQPPRACIEQIKTLSTMRKKLLRIKLMLRNREKTEAYFLSAGAKKEMAICYEASLKAIKADIKNIEHQIDTVLKTDEQLTHLLTLMTSVPQIGTVIACEILIHTNEFKNINCPKRFSSYCGIAPFPHQSGTSVKGRTRVSHIANKEIKQLMHLAAMGSIRRNNSRFATYYLRKVAEGKNKMSVLNAVRNKLVHTVFACVRENKLYEKRA